MLLQLIDKCGSSLRHVGLLQGGHRSDAASVESTAYHRGRKQFLLEELMHLCEFLFSPYFRALLFSFLKI